MKVFRAEVTAVYLGTAHQRAAQAADAPLLRLDRVSASYGQVPVRRGPARSNWPAPRSRACVLIRSPRAASRTAWKGGESSPTCPWSKTC